MPGPEEQQLGVRVVDADLDVGRRQKYDIFEGIPSDEEEPIDYLETQIGLVSQLGEQPYLAQFVNQSDN